MDVTSSEYYLAEHNDDNGQQQPGIVVEFTVKCNDCFNGAVAIV